MIFAKPQSVVVSTNRSPSHRAVLGPSRLLSSTLVRLKRSVMFKMCSLPVYTMEAPVSKICPSRSKCCMTHSEEPGVNFKVHPNTVISRPLRCFLRLLLCTRVYRTDRQIMKRVSRAFLHAFIGLRNCVIRSPARGSSMQARLLSCRSMRFPIAVRYRAIYVGRRSKMVGL